jgi:hypothetical protein
MGHDADAPLVEEHNFVLATRDTGYRTPAAALAELIDNALQAGATVIQVYVMLQQGTASDLSVAVLDNGSGMDLAVLRSALQFGGTTRFNDRSGPGRYGMGLPNSSVSYARRVEVYSWLKPTRVLHTYLDVDEIAERRTRGVPEPHLRALPEWVRRSAGETGTLVMWSRCDRLEGRRVSTIVRHLHQPFARTFRYFLWRGLQLTINDEPVQPFDPLFLNPESPLTGGLLYGKPLLYRVRVPVSPRRTAKVQVRFAEVPVSAWHGLPVEDKRRYGIVKGAGVSVVRAYREVAYGWYFMGRKRKENYDDWWRCEVSFDPDLDEYFGLTHSKQAINPVPELEAILTPDIEAIAHALNARARAAFRRVPRTETSGAAKYVSRKELQLPPVQSGTTAAEEMHSTGVPWSRDRRGLSYRLTTDSPRDASFYSYQLRGRELVVILNREHPFFEKFYRPLAKESPRVLGARLECLLFALARAEADAPSRIQQYWYRRKRLKWSDALAAFLGR